MSKESCWACLLEDPLYLNASLCIAKVAHMSAKLVLGTCTRLLINLHAGA